MKISKEQYENLLGVQAALEGVVEYEGVVDVTALAYMIEMAAKDLSEITSSIEGC